LLLLLLGLYIVLLLLLLLQHVFTPCVTVCLMLLLLLLSCAGRGAMLAVAFQAHGGQAAVKNWKRSIKVEAEDGLRCSIGYWLRQTVDEQQLAELLQQHVKAAHAQRPQNQTLPRTRRQQQQGEADSDAGSEGELQQQQQEEDEEQTQQQQQQQAGFSTQAIRSIQQMSRQQQQRRNGSQLQQLVCIRSKWYGKECYLVADGSSSSMTLNQQQQQQGAAAAETAGDGVQQQREYLYTSWRENTHTWRAVVSLPAAVRQTQLSSSSGSGAIVTIGNLYTSAAAAGTAADLAQLAVLGVWVGMRLNFPLASYTAEQQRQRSGAELLQYLQQLRRRVPGFTAAAAAGAVAAGVRRSARGLKGAAGDGSALARWHAERAHQRRCGLCTGCLSGRSCVVAAWRRQQQQVSALW
jgi:hypothetical protein